MMNDAPPTTCPVCDSDLIRSDGEQYDDGYYFVYMRCDNDCDSTWTEVYQYIRTAVDIEWSGDPKKGN